MQTTNKYITVAYNLYSSNKDKKEDLVETAPVEHPFQFISGMGLTLDAFESLITPLNKGEKFDFVISADDAYGKYEKDHVLELDKEIFCVDGRLDTKNIFPGNYVPMMNEDGNRFEGLVVEVNDSKVIMDFNHRLAGFDLHFVGEVVESREATAQEIEGQIKRMSGEGGCGCGCDSCGGGCDCDDDCEGSHSDSCGCGHCH